MTTPTDAIAGLIERLKGRLGPSRTVTVGPGLYEDVSESATAIDSLLKERDALRNEINDWANEVARYKSYAEKFDQENAALQATVKELEARPPLLDAKSIPRVGALVRTLEARATRLQQERDEAYERAAKVAENPGFIEAQDTDWDLGVNFAKGFIAAAIRQLAARHEKEKK